MTTANQLDEFFLELKSFVLIKQDSKKVCLKLLGSRVAVVREMVGVNQPLIASVGAALLQIAPALLGVLERLTLR